MANYKTTTGPLANGTFTYTPPNPPTTTNGTLGGTYTLSDGVTVLTMTNTNTNGNAVQFTVTTGGVDYAFHGAYATGKTTIDGTCTYPALALQVDTWAATEQ